jgi:hypothetical protein
LLEAVEFLVDVHGGGSCEGWEARIAKWRGCDVIASAGPCVVQGITLCSCTQDNQTRQEQRDGQHPAANGTETMTMDWGEGAGVRRIKARGNERMGFAIVGDGGRNEDQRVSMLSGATLTHIIPEAPSTSNVDHHDPFDTVPPRHYSPPFRGCAACYSTGREGGTSVGGAPGPR